MFLLQKVSHLVIFSLFLVCAVSDDSNTAPTAWYWITGSPSTISNRVKNGYRIVDLELYSTSPFKLTALLVKNSGPYKQTWWWYYNIDAQTLSSKISSLKARIVDIEAYYISGELKFSVVLTPNTGANAKAWWYYYGVDTGFISTKLSENKARLVDIDAYKDGSATRYAVVMIRNNGEDQRAWWWYYGVSTSFISGRLSANRARLMDLEYLGNNRWAVIMERSKARWYWYYGFRSSKSLLSRASQNGARIFHVVPYKIGGRRYWACIMIANLDDISERAYNYIASKRTGGSFGFYMRQINGPVYASLMSTAVYEPASSIKALHHAHAMRRVQNGLDDLSNNLIVPTSMTGSCPTSGAPFVSRSLETVLSRMMQNSDNADTQAIVARYGQSEINLSAQSLGMTQSRVAHRIGCAGSSTGIVGQVAAPNWLSLVDITKLYSGVATTWLTSTNRAKYFDLMLTYNEIFSVINQEASKLSLSTSSTTVTNFKAGVLAKQKGGSYTINGKYYKSVGAYVKLPRGSCLGRTTYYEYVLGAFIDQATADPGSSVVRMTGAETLREAIKTGLMSFKPCFQFPPVLKS